MTTRNIAYIGLGSNLGDRLGNLIAAVTALTAHAPLADISSVYESEPMGYIDQPLFLNAACAVTKFGSPRELLSDLKRIERLLGRAPAPRWGPRAMDLDILAIGSTVVSEPDLQIPHPRLAERLFVCLPLAEIAPEYRPPGQTLSVSQLRDRLTQTQVVRLLRRREELLPDLPNVQWVPGNDGGRASANRAVEQSLGKHPATGA